ncbi:MAG: GFA family protein [Burkholderiales bacterium]|nr:MAG: GFA family protein [Burkholderiales bacterium]
MTTADAMSTYRGSCHCGRVQFEVRTKLTRVSECNCSICRRKGYLHHMVPPDRFRLLQGEDALTTYQFGTGRAQHQFCKVCGVASFYRPRANPANYMINARCLEGVDLDRLERVRFDGASWESRPDAPYTGIWNV